MKDAVYHRKPKYEDPDKDNRPSVTTDDKQMDKSGAYKMHKGSYVGVPKALAEGSGNLKRGKGMGKAKSGGGR